MMTSRFDIPQGLTLLLTLLLTTTVLGCASSQGGSPSDAPRFKATPISEGLVRVEVNLSGVAPAPGSMLVLCGSAQLTVDKGYRYFHMGNRSRSRPGVGAFDLTLTNAPAGGARVVELKINAPPPADLDEDSYIDAPSTVSACEFAGFNPSGTP